MFPHCVIFNYDDINMKVQMTEQNASFRNKSSASSIFESLAATGYKLGVFSSVPLSTD